MFSGGKRNFYKFVHIYINITCINTIGERVRICLCVCVCGQKGSDITIKLITTKGKKKNGKNMANVGNQIAAHKHEKDFFKINTISLLSKRCKCK